MFAILNPPYNVLIENYKVHINVFVELNEIFLSFLLGGTNDNEKIYIQKGQTERAAGFVFLNPFKLGLLYLSHLSLFRIYSYQKKTNTRWVSIVS